MRSRVIRSMTFLGLSIAVLSLWASPASAHGGQDGRDWHRGDRGSFTGTSDPDHHCDHDGTSASSDAAAEKAAAKTATTPDVDADEANESAETEPVVEAPAPAVVAPEAVKVVMQSARADAIDRPMIKASSNSEGHVPVAAWMMALVVLFGGASAPVRRSILRR